MKEPIAFRIQGNSFQRPDKTWSWEMTIISPDGDSWSKHYSSDLPGFLNKDLAIRDMRAEVERTVHSIKGLEGVGGVRAINLKTGQEDFKNEDRS